MNPKTRRLILTLMILVFLIAGPLLILYSIGWRINFKTFTINKTGAVFLKINDPNIKISVNNKILNRRDRSSGGLLVSNLSARTYDIKISKEGYQVWEKNLSVSPSYISESAEIVLAPKIEFARLLKSGVQDFALNGNQLVWQDEEGDFFLTNVANLDFNLNLSLLFNNLKERQLNFIGWVPIAKVSPQENPNQFIIETAKAAYLLDVKKLKLQLISKTSPLLPPPLTSPDKTKIASPLEKNLVVVKNGKPIKFDLKINESLKEITWYKDSEHLFIKYPDRLYFLEIDDRPPLNFNLIAENVKKYAYEPKNNRLYLLINNDLRYLDF